MIRIPTDQCFYLRDITQLHQECRRLAIDLPVHPTIDPLFQPLPIANRQVPNRFVAQLMLGSDAQPDGTPSKHTFHRIQRYAGSNYGWIRTEPVAIESDQRRHPRQLVLSKSGQAPFTDCCRALREAGHTLLLHLDHTPEPAGEAWTRQILNAIDLAATCGFDGLLLNVKPDIHTNLENMLQKCRTSFPDFIVAARCCLYEAVPGGFGVDRTNYRLPDPSEPVALARRLQACGVHMIEGTTRHPNLRGAPTEALAAADYPHDHPLSALTRRTTCCRAIREAVPGLIITASGFSWLRQFMPPVAAGLIEGGYLDGIGLERFALAYPGTPATVRERGQLDPSRCCIQCQACHALSEANAPVQCLVHEALPLSEISGQCTPPKHYAPDGIADGLTVRQIHYETARLAREQGMTGIHVPVAKSPRTIAVVGAGPCGLAATATLLAQGHTVRLIEQSDQLGGVPERLIPSTRYQSASEAIAALLKPALDAGRLTVHLNCAFGTDITLERLLDEQDAILIATGLWHEDQLDSGEGTWSGLAFLERIKRHGPPSPVPLRAAILCGGDCAMDVAVLLRAWGVQTLYMIYEGAREEMHWCLDSAWLDQPGVECRMHTHVIAVERDDDNQLKGLRLQPTDDIRSPSPQTDSIMEVDGVVDARGLTMDPALREALRGVPFTPDDGLVARTSHSFATSMDRVFAAGAICNGGTSIASCIEEGIQAAQEIHRMWGP